MDTSSDPPEAPARARADTSSTRLGATARSASARKNASAVAPTTGRLPRRDTSHPASGIETSEPAAMPSSATPRSPSLRPSLSCTAGMRTAQLPNPKPLRKKIPSTASRAAHNERSVIDLDLKKSLLPCNQTNLAGSRPGPYGARTAHGCSPPAPLIPNQEQRGVRAGYRETRAGVESNPEPPDQCGGGSLPTTHQDLAAGSGDGGERGEAQRRADLRGGVQEAGGQPLLALSGGRGSEGGRGDRRAPKARAREHQAHRKAGEAAPCRDAPEYQRGRRHEDQARDHGSPGTDASGEPGADEGARDDRQAEREVREASGGRREVQHPLQVQDEDHAYGARGSRQHGGDEVGTHDVARAKDAKGDEGVSGSPFDEKEGPDQGGGEGERSEHRKRTEAGLFDPCETVDESDETRGDGDGAKEIQPPRRSIVAAFGDESGGQRQAERGHGDVDEKDPLPPEPIRDEATQDEAGRAPARGDGRPHAQSAVPLPAVGKGRGDNGEGCWSGDRRPEPLRRAAKDQDLWRARKAADEGGCSEEGEPRHERPPAAEEVRGPACQ